MKKAITFLMLMIGILIGGETVSAATVETSLMEGTVGKYKIKMKLWRNLDNGTVTGWYYYTSKGAKNKIQLSGKMSPKGNEGLWDCNIVLTEKVNGKVTGTFDGYFNYGQMTGEGFSGSWSSPKGTRLNFSVYGGGRP